MAATFEYWQSSKDSQWWFHLKEDGNSKIILASTEGYESESGCRSRMNSTRSNAPWDHNYAKFDGNDGNYYFTLKAGNREPISKSEAYDSAPNRDRGIENCKLEAPRAMIKRIYK